MKKNFIESKPNVVMFGTSEGGMSFSKKLVELKSRKSKRTKEKGDL